MEAWVVIPLPRNFLRERKIKYSNRAASSASNMSSLLWKKKKKLGYAARREFRVWAIFQPGPLVSRFTPGGFSINFSGLVYISKRRITLWSFRFPSWKNSSSIIFPILVSFSTFFLLFNVNLILFLVFDISIIYKLKIRNKEKLFDRLSYILEFNLTLIHHLTRCRCIQAKSRHSILLAFFDRSRL